MSADVFHACENALKGALDTIRTGADVARIAEIYEEVKSTVATAIKPGRVELDSAEQRDLMSLMLYVHLAARTKEADDKNVYRVLAVR